MNATKHLSQKLRNVAKLIKSSALVRETIFIVGLTFYCFTTLITQG